jgi:6-phospho-beta-glucosidase
MGVKVAVVGAGSTYTPELIEGLAARADRLPVEEIALLDVAPDRLGVVAGLARRMLARAGHGASVRPTLDRAEALDGAGYVILQLRVGGQAARLIDETLPLRFGCIGQETTGPGGFAKALRTVPVVLELADEVVRRAADAWIVDFTNPTGIVTQALLDHGFRAVGLCNVAISLQRRLAALLGVSPHRVELEHVGLNHLSWERTVRVDGRDRLPELLRDHLDVLVEESGLPPGLIMALGAIPSPYLRFYYLTGRMLAYQRTHRARAEEVMEIESRLLELYRDPQLDRKPELLGQRGGAFYSEAAAQLLASLHADAGDVQVVDVANRGALPDLPDDAVVEVPARIRREGITPIPLSPLAPELRGLVQQVKAYELLTVRAAETGDRSVALKALLANPLVRDYDIAEPLLDALLAANAAYLPRFST